MNASADFSCARRLFCFRLGQPPVKTLAEHLGVVDLKPEPAGQDEIKFDENMSIEEFCRGVLKSRTYRESIQRRILIDELPPAIELMMWDRAFGTRKKQIEVEHRDSSVQNWNEEQLAERELALVRHLRTLRMNGTGETSSDEDDESPPPSVH